MANLTIRNIDNGIVESLRAQAKRHNRSLEAEVRQVLADEIRRPARILHADDLGALAERIVAMMYEARRAEEMAPMHEACDHRRELR